MVNTSTMSSGKIRTSVRPIQAINGKHEHLDYMVFVAQARIGSIIILLFFFPWIGIIMINIRPINDSDGRGMGIRLEFHCVGIQMVGGCTFWMVCLS